MDPSLQSSFPPARDFDRIATRYFVVPSLLWAVALVAIVVTAACECSDPRVPDVPAASAGEPVSATAAVADGT